MLQLIRLTQKLLYTWEASLKLSHPHKAPNRTSEGPCGRGISHMPQAFTYNTEFRPHHLYYVAVNIHFP